MLVAAVDDGPYNLVYLLHIVSVIVGVGGALLGPVLATRARFDGVPHRFIDEALAWVIAPALLAAGVFGGALVGMSGDVYDFGQTWLSAGGAVWLVAVAVAALLYPPPVVRLPAVDDRRRVLMGVLHLSLAAMLFLMVWKPGH